MSACDPGSNRSTGLAVPDEAQKAENEKQRKRTEEHAKKLQSEKK